MTEQSHEDLTLDDIRKLVESGEVEVPDVDNMTRDELLETVKAFSGHHEEHHDLDRKREQLISNLALKLARAAEYMDHFVYHALQGKPAPLGENNLVELQAMKTPEEPVEMPKLRALVAGGEGAAVYLFRTDAELTTAIFKCLFHGEATPAQQEEVEGYHQALLAGFDVELSDGWLRLYAVTED